jgi:dipeptidyl aminopeptidase/acylaminoacyl peptidase
VVYTSENAENPGDVWLSDVDFLDPTQLTHLNPELAPYRMGKSQLIDWLDDDGNRLQGALTLPSDYENGKRYPLVVLVYGGDYVSDSLERFGGFDRALPYMNIQILATRGYAVLEPDAPQHLGTPLLDLAKTTLPAVSRVVEMGIADSERIGVMGQSYGGYSTLSLLVQTKRFKAAVSTSGIGNLVGFYGELDKDGTAYGTLTEAGQGLMGGTLWDYRDRYIENSPIFYLDRVDTPLLLVSGSDDTTAAPFLSDEVFVGLRRLGKTVEYRKYYGEEHQVDGYENQLDLGNRITAWFDQYLRSPSGGEVR